MIHIVKCFSLVNETEVIIFFNFLPFSMIKQMLAIWSLVLLTFLNLIYIWKFLVHVLLKSSLKDFEHYLASMWNEHYSLILNAQYSLASVSVCFGCQNDVSETGCGYDSKTGSSHGSGYWKSEIKMLTGLLSLLGCLLPVSSHGLLYFPCDCVIISFL